MDVSLSIDDTVLRKIIRALYYPESPYEFSVLSADILGQVYEQFLGKTIRLTKSHQVKIEEKPEVKKAGGVFYTPEYVVEYIVNRTIGPLVEGKHAHEVAGRTKTTWKPSKTGRALTVLDPACGSGSFLIGSYQFLLDWYLNHYIETGPKKFKDRVFQTKKEEWRLTTAERKRILLDHIFGVDIDSQAVEVTKLSLLLKVLEGENRENLERQLRLFRDRALPDLSSNIKCGNSLIGSDFYSGVQMDLFDSEEMLQINAFDWAGKHGFKKFMEVGGFDCIVGNPPYDVLEKDRGKSSWPHSALRGYIDGRSEFSNALGGKLNLFRFFVVRSLQLTRVGGRFGNIIPLSILADISCANTRRHVMLSSDDIRCDCFPQKDNPNRRVFKNAKLSTLVLTCCRRKEVKPSAAKLEIRVFPWNSFDDACKTAAIKLSETKLIDKKNTPIPLVDAIDWNLCRKIHKQSNVMRLGDVPDFNVTRGEINQTVFREYITSDSRRSRLLKGVEVGQFVVHDKLSQGEREWFNEHEYLKSKPPRDLVAQRRIATQRITGVDERLRVVATVVDPPMYFADSTNSVAITQGAKHDLLYLLGLLNSSLYQWRFKLTSTNNNVGTNELDCMPFRVIDFGKASDKKKHKRMVEVVSQLLALRGAKKAKTSHAKTVVQRQLETLTSELDQIVYSLFGLTEKDISIVTR